MLLPGRYLALSEVIGHYSNIILSYYFTGMSGLNFMQANNSRWSTFAADVAIKEKRVILKSILLKCTLMHHDL